MRRRLFALALAPLSSLLVVGALPGAAHAAKPTDKTPPQCEDVGPSFGESGTDCDY